MQNASAARATNARATQLLLLALLAVSLFAGCVRFRGSRVRVADCEVTQAADTGYHLVAAVFHVASALSGD